MSRATRRSTSSESALRGGQDDGARLGDAPGVDGGERSIDVGVDAVARRVERVGDLELAVEHGGAAVGADMLVDGGAPLPELRSLSGRAAEMQVE